MSFEWKQVRLGDFIDSCLGKMLDQKKNRGTFHPYLGNSNVRWGEFDLSNLSEMKFEDTEHERYSLKKGDLVVCEGGEPGRCAIWDDEIPGMKIQKALHRIRTLPGLTSGYLYYWFLFSGKKGTLEPYFTGTTIKHLTGRSLADLTIRLPPVKYQEKCALILSSIDRKINHNKKINQTLEQMAQALFKSWFVDFEPVKVKIAVLEAGGSQEHATLAAMTAISGKDTGALVIFEREHPQQYAELKATAKLFPSAMQKSELGYIPEGWKPGCIGNISQRIRTKVGSSFAVVLSAIASGELVPSDEHFTKQVYSKSIEKYILVEQWSFAYNPSRINIGSIGLNVRSLNGAVSPVYVVFKTEPEYKWYIETLTKTTYFKSNVNILASGSVRQSLSYDDLASIPLCIPEVIIVNIFNEKYEEYLSLIEKYRNQNNTLVSIRDTLLPKLLSGEITLQEAEQAVSEVESV